MQLLDERNTKFTKKFQFLGAEFSQSNGRENGRKIQTILSSVIDKQNAKYVERDLQEKKEKCLSKYFQFVVEKTIVNNSGTQILPSILFGEFCLEQLLPVSKLLSRQFKFVYRNDKILSVSNKMSSRGIVT